MDLGSVCVTSMTKSKSPAPLPTSSEDLNSATSMVFLPSLLKMFSPAFVIFRLSMFNRDWSSLWSWSRSRLCFWLGLPAAWSTSPNTEYWSEQSEWRWDFTWNQKEAFTIVSIVSNGNCIDLYWFDGVSTSCFSSPPQQSIPPPVFPSFCPLSFGIIIDNLGGDN